LTPERRSPLDGWSLEMPDLRLRELPHVAQVSLRALRPPSLPALQLGPDEWLVVGGVGALATIVGRLEAEVAGQRAQVIDLTASRTTIEIAGRGASELLAKGCGLDLHPRAFPSGHAAATLLARTNVILARIDDAPTWRVFVRASYARYLRDWLVAAATAD
jgi:sarcosine oxidase subunit gamma